MDHKFGEQCKCFPVSMKCTSAVIWHKFMRIDSCDAFISALEL